MRRIVLGLTGLCLLAGFGLTISNNVGGAQIYTVAALRAHLAADPRGWVGRTVLVRGIAVGRFCPPGASCVFGGPAGLALVDAGAPAAARALPLTMGPANGLLALLRRLPLLARVVPGPQQIHWWAPAVYRVELRLADGACGTGPCYSALLPDAALRPYPMLMRWSVVAKVPFNSLPRPSTPPAATMPRAVP